MKRVVLLLLHFYQHVLAFIFPANSCRFYPSCSTYAMQAIERFGIFRGGLMGINRLFRCHPWHEGGFDPVPDADTGSQGGTDNTPNTLTHEIR